MNLVDKKIIFPAALLCLALGVATSIAQTYKPKHVNRAIELLAEGQPIYYTGSHSGTTGTFEQGVKDAQTFADYISYDMEHAPFDVKGLSEYMQRPGKGRSDEERPSHAGRHRECAGERHRRGVGSRKRVDVQSGAGDRRARRPADACRRSGRGARVRRGDPFSDPQAGRGQEASTKAGAACMASPRRREIWGVSQDEYLDEGRRMAAQPERRTAAGR